MSNQTFINALLAKFVQILSTTAIELYFPRSVSDFRLVLAKYYSEKSGLASSPKARDISITLCKAK